MSHYHFCDYEGHYWDCRRSAVRQFADASEPTQCMCVKHLVSMEDGDHSECPVELLACPEHRELHVRQMNEFQYQRRGRRRKHAHHRVLAGQDPCGCEYRSRKTASIRGPCAVHVRWGSFEADSIMTAPISASCIKSYSPDDPAPQAVLALSPPEPRPLPRGRHPYPGCPSLRNSYRQVQRGSRSGTRLAYRVR
jgi:hypothetical protein